MIGDEMTHRSDLGGSSLSVLETIAPSETVLDPIPEDDDPDVTHRGWKRAIDTGLRTGNPVWAFCGKLVYIPTVHRELRVARNPHTPTTKGFSEMLRWPWERVLGESGTRLNGAGPSGL